MTLQDITASEKWAGEYGTVLAHLTVHHATAKDRDDQPDKDHVRYANGFLSPEGAGLAGDLDNVYANTDSTPLPVPEGKLPTPNEQGMKRVSTLAYRVTVDDAGSLSVQQLLKGKPIGGMPPVVMPLQAVSSSLFTANDGSTLYALSLDRRQIVMPA